MPRDLAESAVGRVAPSPVMSARITGPAIVAGVDDTGAGGPTAGEFVVRVSGFDRSKRKDPNDELEDVPLLFPEYVTRVKIPVPGNRLDIVVPKRRR